MRIYLNANKNEITYNKKDYLLRAAEGTGLFLVDFNEPDNLEREYVLNIEPCTIQAGKIWTGLWHIDVLLNSDYYPNIYGEANSVFISTNQSKYDMKDTHVLFQAADLKLHRRIPEIEQKFDFVMCGSNGGGIWSQRAHAFELLGEKFKYHDFGKDNIPENYVKIINQAKVQFIRTGEGDEGKGACAQRFFECLAIGPVLTNYTDDIPLLGLIEDRDFMTYKNDKEMMAKMKKLIGDEKLRKYIAENGRKQSVLKHSYGHRLISILNTINEL